nr:hemin storage system protein [Klebsiella pneumoniae]
MYLLIAALNGWLLILWYHYNRRRARTRRHTAVLALRDDELASSFNVAPQIISEMSRYNLLTVYHDQIGQIIDLKATRYRRRRKRAMTHESKAAVGGWTGNTPGISRRLF